MRYFFLGREELFKESVLQGDRELLQNEIYKINVISMLPINIDVESLRVF